MKAKLDIAILGVMGSGKSSVAKALSDKTGYALYSERFDDNPYLEPYYNDMIRYGVANQLWFMDSKAKQHIDISFDTGSTIQDSPLCMCEVFILSMEKLNILSHDDSKLLLSIYNNFIDRITPRPTNYIYLKCDPDIILGRITNRDRKYEKSINNDYIKVACDVLDKCVSDSRYDNCLTVNGNGPINDIISEICNNLKI